MEIDIVLDSHLPQRELTELGLLAERHGLRNKRVRIDERCGNVRRRRLRSC